MKSRIYTDGEFLRGDGSSWPDTVDAATLAGLLDHGLLTGLGDDDHTQYLLIDGTRAMTGDLNVDTNSVLLAEVVDPGYADANEVWIHAQDVAGITQLHYNTEIHKWTLAQDQWVVARNTSGSSMTAGQVVKVSGSTGSRPEIALADADTDHTILGILQDAVANNGYGAVVIHGYVRNIDTSAFVAGDELYLSQTAGGLTTTIPTQPAYGIEVGQVITAHATQGIIYVNSHEHAVITISDAYFGADIHLAAGSVLNWNSGAATITETSGTLAISALSTASATITGGTITGITDLVVADGGTGRSTATAYAVICGGTTATGAHQSIASVGTSGQVLTSNGASALPTFQDAASGGTLTVSQQVFTASGTWTKPSNLVAALIELVGGGGGSGGCEATGTGESNGGAGGGAGGYSRKLVLTASLGSTETVTIGAAGAAGGSGTAGGTGGTTSFGAHCSATGGTGGGVGASSTSVVPSQTPGTGGTGSSGDVNVTGAGGLPGIGFANASRGLGGKGGDSLLGGGGAGVVSTSTHNGTAGGNYGGGGGAGATGQSQSAHGGSAGAAGIVIVTEYRFV